MSKVELTISPDYVPSWTIVDAIRELFQNAIDQETQCPGNNIDWNYDSHAEKLTISNKTSVLTMNTLLLGQTSKANDSSTIGQFGEGYKIATLVLLRNDKQITFYNYGAREIWRPRFVNSRKFGTKVLTFFIEKVSVWNHVPDADLTIEIAGITPDEYYNEIVPSNLMLRADYDVVESTCYGDVLDLPGKVFVNGLYVCDYEPYTYGYNFKPEYIKLDRDRKMVSDFDLRWMASKMWSASEDSEKVMTMVAEGKADVVYLGDVSWSSKWRDIAADTFKSIYGPEAIPVTSQAELDSVPAGYKGVVVNSAYNDLIKRSIKFSMPAPEITLSEPVVELQDWFDSIKSKLDDDEIEQFEAIMEDLKNANM